LRIQDI
jgi:hypothetical protein